MQETILYTRESPLSQNLCQAFEKKQLKVLSIPLIKTVALSFTVPQQTYDWLLFTSSNAVNYFFSSKMTDVKAAVIGEKTKIAAQQAGYEIGFQSYEGDGDSFVNEWLAFTQEHKTPSGRPLQVLFPRSKIASSKIISKLVNAGIEVTDLSVYDTVFPPEQEGVLLQAINTCSFTYAVFASPSAWHHFYQVFEKSSFRTNQKYFFSKIKILSIGPVTSRAILEKGCQVALESREYTMDALIEKFLEER